MLVSVSPLSRKVNQKAREGSVPKTSHAHPLAKVRVRAKEKVRKELPIRAKARGNGTRPAKEVL